MPLKRRKSVSGFLFLAWILLMMVATGHGWAATRVAVLYPDVDEPYRSVFQTILRGIGARTGAAASPYPLADDFDSGRLRTWLQEQRVESIIALGKQGYQAVKAAGGQLPVIIGALPVTPEDMAGVSLAPDPNVLFRHLKDLAPEVERVHVVFSESSRWLIKPAEAAAKARGLQLAAYPANDLREAVHHYRELLEKNTGSSQSIWLPLDNITADDEVVLPMLLQAAWDKRLVIFSSKPSHAQRGVLFSMFPDHYLMGYTLAEMAAAANHAAKSSGMVPLASLQIAVNLRTAAHLGLRFTPRQQEKFDLVFPSH